MLQAYFSNKVGKIGTYDGMFGNEYPLFEYKLKDGRHAVAFLQAAPWSSGPMFFIGLKINDGTEFLWDEKEIERY